MNYVERLRKLGKDVEKYRYQAGHGTHIVDEQIRQAEIRIDFSARHLRTAKPT